RATSNERAAPSISESAEDRCIGRLTTRSLRFRTIQICAKDLPTATQQNDSGVSRPARHLPLRFTRGGRREAVFHPSRREVLGVLGGALAAWPRVACAQQPAVRVIGYLTNGAGLKANGVGAFRKGLSDMGFVEGRNVAFEIGVAEQYEQFPALALQLVGR